ncbi:MAG: response regulator [Calditrichaeota bacterium]|nr:MAG: response regulator [Calditrichota bacterium]
MAKKILVVDDSATTRSSVQYILSQAGYNVALANDGSDGLRKIDEVVKGGDSLSMIITDINMPVMDGIRFTQSVKSGPHKSVPVLVLTTESQDSKKQQGRQAGAAGWLVKPFQPDQLVTVVRKLAG